METLEDVFLKLCQQDSTLADTAEPGVTTDGLLLNTTDNTVYTDDSLVFQGAETSAYSIEFRHHGDRSQLLEDSQRSSTSKHYRHLQPGEFSTNTHSTDLEHSSKCCTRCWSWFSLPKPTNILALVIKNLIIMSRNLGFLFFEFMLPSIQIILFCLCIGPEPRDLTVAIVNQDQGMLGMNCGAMVINHLSNETFAKVNYSDLTSALNTVKQGDAWGAVFVGKNFTQDLFLRVSNTSSVDNKTIDGSSVKLYLDMTNQQIALSIQQEIMTGFQAFTTDMLRSLGLNVHAADLPVKLEEPVYGDRKPSFTNFMAPGIIISITFFMACGLTALAFVLERKEGLLDRSLTT
ncbi:ABC transporter G family member 23-like, partial [Lingula anatina]|uniref:ABC transporter G family member 23-like n=1 Tax=Lingula anatina TaxID=7574 RepID=A0A2R2MMZ0_LINAN